MSAQALTDVSELKTFFTGDTTSLEKAATRSEAVVARTAQNINQTLSTSPGFDYLSQGASRVQSSVQASMGGVSSATSQAAASIQSNMGSASQAVASAATNVGNLGPSAQAASAQVNSATQQMAAGLQGVGAASQGAGQQVGTGLQAASTSAQAAQQAIAQFESQILSNREAIAQYSVQIADNRSALDAMKAAIREKQRALVASGQTMAEARAATADLTGAYSQLAGNTRTLIGEKGKLAAQNQTLAVQIDKTAATSTNLGGVMGFLRTIFTTQTNQISSAGTMWQGYDRLVQSVANTTGFLTIGTSLLITAFGILAPSIVGALTRKRELVTITKELVENDLKLAQTFGELARAAGGTNEVLNKQAELYDKLLKVDIQGLLIQYVDQFEKEQKALKDVIQAQAGYEQSQRRLAETQSGIVIRGDQVIDVYSEMKTQADHMIEANSRLTTAHNTEQVALQKTQDALILLYNSGRLTTSQLEEMAAKSDRVASAIGNLTGFLLRAADAQEVLNAAARNYKPPSIATTGFAGDLRADQLKALETVNSLNAAGRSQADIFNAVKPILDSAGKKAGEMAAREAAAANATLNHNQMLQRQRGIILDDFQQLAPYVNMLSVYDKNVKALSDSHEKHARGARSSSAALNSFKDSAVGLERALQLLTSAGSKLDILFEVVNRRDKAAVAQLNEYKNAIKAATPAVNEFLQSQSKAAKVTEEELTRMAQAGNSSLFSLTLGYKQESQAREALALSTIAANGTQIESEQRRRTAILETNKEVTEAFKRANAGAIASGQGYVSWGVKVDEATGKAVAFRTQLDQVQDTLSKAPGFDQITRTTVEFARNTTILFSDAADTLVSTWSQSADRMGFTMTEKVAYMEELFSRLDPAISGPVRTALDKVKQDLANTGEFTKSWFNELQKKLTLNPTLSRANFGNQLASEMDSVVRVFEQEAQRLGLVGQAAWQHVVDKTREVSGTLSAEAQAAGEKQLRAYAESLTPLPEVWDEILLEIQKATGEWSVDLTKEIRTAISDILTIFELMPGSVGDSLRKVESEFRRFYGLLDSVIKTIQRMLGDQQPGGLGGILQEAIGGIFKSSNALPQVQHDFKELISLVGDTGTKAAAQAGAKIGLDFSKGFLANASLITAGVGAIFGTKGQGALMGGISGALGGASIALGAAGLLKGVTVAGLFTGPAAPFLIGGIGVAAALGAIFGRKSAAEKERERLQKELAVKQMRDQIVTSEQQKLQALEATKQSITETQSKIRDLLNSLASTAEVPTDVINRFVENSTKLLTSIVEAAKQFAPEQLEAVKRLSDNTGGMIDVLSNLGGVYQAVVSQVNITREQARSYVSGFMLLIEEIAGSEVGRKLQRKAAETTERIKDVPAFVVSLAEALRATVELPDLPDEAKFITLEQTTKSILTRLNSVFTELDRWQLKVTGAASTEALPILEFTTNLSSTLNQAVNQKIPTEADWRNLLEGGKAGIDVAFDLFESIQAEMLARTSAASEQASPILTLLNNLFGVNKAAVESGQIGTIDFAALRAQAHGLFQLAIDLASDFSAEARQAGSAIAEETKDIPSFASAIFGAIKAGGDIGDARLDAERLKQDGAALIGAVIALSTMFASDELKRAVEASEGGTLITDFAKGLGESLKSLSESGSVGAAMITGALAAYEAIVNGMAQMRARISAEALGEAKSLASDTSSLFENVSRAGSAMKSAAETRVADFSPFFVNVHNYVDALARAREITIRGVNISADFRSDTELINANMMAGIANLSEAVHAAATTPTASAAAAAFSAGLNPAVTPTPAAPIGITGPTRDGSSRQIVISPGAFVFHGTVIDKFNFKEAVREVLDDAERR